ncbi:MAG: SusC/RagA family TonB-linked outer membrane protein [Ferruginibacter sp.]
MIIYLSPKELQNFFSLPKSNKLIIKKSDIKNMMRIGIVTITLLITASIQLLFALPLKSQPIDEVKVELGLHDETLIQAFQKIEALTSYHFMYRKDEVSNIRNLKVSFAKKSVEDFLRIFLTNTNLTYKQVNDQILIKAAKVIIPAVASIESVLPYIPKSSIVNGKITNAQGEPLEGVNITVKQSNVGTSSNRAGSYSIDVPGNGILVFSYVGFVTQEVAVNNQSAINVVLQEESKSLGAVVVTALGIKKEARSLGYATGTVNTDQLAINRTTNVGNSLVGKVAGVNVSEPTSGPGGSSKIRIRGQSSFGSYNSPLIIVDGVPMDNSGLGATSGNGANPNQFSSDGGDGLQSLSPDNIGSMTVLKGAAAAALYGFRAKDGAIIITTKTGSNTKGLGVEINSNIQGSTALDYTDYQYEYGQGENGLRPTTVGEAQSSGVWSFGEKFDGALTPQFDGTMKPYSPHDNRIRDFYRTAYTATHSIALSGGNDKGNFRLSFANTNAENIVPNSGYDKIIMNLGVNYSFSPKFSLFLNANYSHEHSQNPPQIAFERMTIPTTLSTMANSIDVLWMKDNYELADGTETPLARFTGRNNVYWITNKHFENIRKERLFGNAALRYQITDWLYAQGRVMQDYYTRPTDFNRPTGSRDLSPVPVGFNGAYYQDVSTFREVNLDFLIGAKHSFGNFGVDLTAGGNQMTQTRDRLGTYATNFYVRDLYTIGNGQILAPAYTYSKKKVNSLYGMLELSYKSLLYVNLTGRNDWFSTLNPESNNYLYPSASTSFVFSDAIGRPSWLTFGKIRVAYAEVGGDTDPYSNALYYGISTNQLNGLGIGSISTNVSPNPNLRPLKVKETEIGLDLRTFNSRLNLDVSFYRKNTVDEILDVAISQSSGYDRTKVNIGKLRNTGFEGLLTIIPIQKAFTWESGFNIAYNESKVIELAGGQTSFVIAQGYWFGQISHELGKPLASVQAFDYRRDSEGRILSSGGKPQLGNIKTFGSGIPTWTGGWMNTFTYKGFRIFTQIDFKAGHVLMSNTNFNGTREGLVKQTLPGREGGVVMEGFNADHTPNTTAVPAQEYYSSLRGLGAPFVYKGDFVRWRTLSVGYDLRKIVKMDVLKGLYVSLFVNNVLMIKKYLDNLDPEATFATDDNFQGLEVNTLPTVRSFGINLNVKF